MKLKTKVSNSMEIKSNSDSAHQNGDVQAKKKKKKRKSDESSLQINEDVENNETPMKKKKIALKSEVNSTAENNSNHSIENNAKQSKKKKRKFEESTQSPENTSTNPEEIDTSLDLNNRKAEEEPEKLSDEESPPAQLSTKEVNELTAKYLRTSFNSASGLSILRKFVQICTENTERDLASEYIEKSGNVLEILRLLESGDKKNLNNAALVFSGMHIVIMKILAKYPQNIPAAQEACHHFINSHLSVVHAMMSNQSNTKQRKTVLRLLASIVSLGDSLPRELLAHLSFHQETLALLSQQTKPSDPQSVRTCFIHFILAFLVDSRVSVIKALLEKRGLLACIFPELAYDSHEIVTLVLNTTMTYVLQNSGISKTLKLHVFSTPVVQSLVSLYNWKGPRNWPGLKSKKKKSITESIDPEAKEIAVEAVHDFLLVLLTSNRHGIIFNDKSLGTTGRKHNQLVNTILQSLERPWDHEKPCELVSRVLAACPDLIRPQLVYTEPYLAPRPSKKWIAVMDFVRKIIGSLDPENCLKSSLSELTPSQLINATLTLTMPSIVLKKAILPSLNASSIVQRHEAVTTLTIMLRQVKIFLNVVEKNLTASEYSNLHSNIGGNINKNIPTVEKILNAWRQMDEPGDELEINSEEIELTPHKSEYFSGILDLLQAYYDVHPECMNPDNVGEFKNHSKFLLTSLSDLDDIGEEKLNFMKLKAIRIIEVMDSKAFAPNKKFLGKTLLFLISLLDSSSNELKSAGKETIKMLLKSSKIFEDSEDQMNIWLNSFHLLENSGERSKVAQWFVELIPKVVKNAGEYQQLIDEAGKTEGEKTPQNKKSKELLTAKKETMKLMQPRISIPPIFCAAVESLAKNPDESAVKFVSFVTVLTLHCQVSPIALIILTQDIEGLPNEYLNSWRKEETPIQLKKIKILLESDEEAFKVTLKDEVGANPEYEILNLVKMTVFCLTQFIQRDKFSQEQFDGYKRVIIRLLDYSKNSEQVEKKRICVFECSKHLLTHPILLEYFSAMPKGINEKQTIVTTGLVEVFDKIIEVNEECNLEKLLFPFRDKLMEELRTALIKCSGSCWNLKKSQCLIELIEILRLTDNDSQELLKIAVKLPKESLLTDDKKSLSIWGEVIPKLIELLSDRKDLKTVETDSMKETQVIHKLCIYLTYLKLAEVNVEKWENAFEKFFRTFPYNLSAFDAKTFNSLLDRKINQPTVKLICLLTERCAKFIGLIIKYIEKEKSAIEHHDLIFSVLSSNLSYKWENEFLNKIYKQYKEEIVNYFLFLGENKFCMIEHSRAIEHLINLCVPLKTCEKISIKVLSSGDKLETVDLTYIKLLFSLFMKLSKLKESSQEVLIQLLQVLIRLMVSALKKNAKEEDKVLTLCKYISQTVANLKSMSDDFTVEELNKSYSWPQFTRFSLKLGLKNTQDGKSPLPLLETLWKVCDVAYTDKSQNDYVKTLFEMTTSHSEFVNIMLSSTEVKKDLLQLLLILLMKNSSVMMLTHIPLYLSAYNATLNECDQKILLILHHYETSGIKLSGYRPYLFGDAAAAHYSVRGEADTAIWRQPSTSQVLDLFNNDTVTRTIQDFPVNRTMNLRELKHSESVYDPAFYLPLLTHLLADNNVVAWYKVTQSGALALVFAACGSLCKEIRMTAFTVLARFYYHLETTSSKEKLLWMRIIDGLRNGITSLESPLVDARLNCFVSTFLAKSSLVATQPLNPLYSRVQMFFMAKPEFDLSIIPEFLTLFNSSEINHKIHRHWILEVVRDGMNTSLDMEIASKCSLFKALFYFYGCNLADACSKTLILQIIDETVKIPKAGLLLCRDYGLLAWLEEAARKINFRDNENIELVVNIVRTLLNNVLKSNDQDNHVQFILLDVLKTLIPKLSKHTNINSYSKLLSSMRDILRTKSFCEAVSKKNIQNLLEVSRNIVGDVSECTEFLIHNCEYAERKEVPENNDEISIAKFNLRNIVIAWRSQVKS